MSTHKSSSILVDTRMKHMRFLFILEGKKRRGGATWAARCVESCAC
jgi:hypothetical protein